MDVDCPAQAPESEPNEPTVPASQLAVPSLPTPSGPQSTTAPISSPGQQLPSRPPLSYAAVAAGAQSPTTSAPSTAALAAILERAQHALRAFVQASSHLGAEQSSLHPWSELTTRAQASMTELAAAHAGIAAVQALEPAPTPCPAPAPARPPAGRSSRAIARSAWDDRRCIVLDPPTDRIRRQATDISGMGASLMAVLRPLLNAPQGPIVEQLRRTAKGGYCA